MSSFFTTIFNAISTRIKAKVPEAFRDPAFEAHARWMENQNQINGTLNRLHDTVYEFMIDNGTSINYDSMYELANGRFSVSINALYRAYYEYVPADDRYEPTDLDRTDFLLQVLLVDTGEIDFNRNVKKSDIEHQIERYVKSLPHTPDLDEHKIAEFRPSAVPGGPSYMIEPATGIRRPIKIPKKNNSKKSDKSLTSIWKSKHSSKKPTASKDSPKHSLKKNTASKHSPEHSPKHSPNSPSKKGGKSAKRGYKLNKQYTKKRQNPH